MDEKQIPGDVKPVFPPIVLARVKAQLESKVVTPRPSVATSYRFRRAMAVGCRIYKEGMPHEKAVDAFVERQDEIHAIATRFADTKAVMAAKALQRNLVKDE